MPSPHQHPREVEERPAHVVARESYVRCLRGEGFFDTLYATLLASDPSIPPFFEHTEFPRQHRLLQHGIGLLLSYAHNPDPTLLDRVAARHGPDGINVRPSLYVHFLESLVTAVRTHDSESTYEVEEAWREAVRPGVEFMSARYES